MASHYSTIGCPIETTEGLVDLAQRVMPSAEAVAAGEGRYLRWTSQSGAELWLQQDHKGTLIGVSPHFRGPSRVEVGSLSGFTREREPTLDGAFHGWAAPEGEVEGSGAYPFVFDCPDFRVAREGRGRRVVAQIAAFAHEVKLYDSTEAHAARQEGPVKFASQSFVPVGLFGSDGRPEGPPDAFAIFTGHVLETEVRVNELYGRTFIWAAVATLGGHYDVVIDPDLVERAPATGNVLSGTFWLTGRLLGA